MNPIDYSSFKKFLSSWQNYLESDKFKEVIKKNELCFFFKFEKKVYGASEESRLVFARIKNPDEEDDETWGKQATFVAFDLNEKSQRIFNKKDIKKIKVIELK